MKRNYHTKLFVIKILTMTVLVTICIGIVSNDFSFTLDYEVVLETVTRGQDKEYIWTHACSAAIPADTPAAGSAQWTELPNGDVLLPIFYFNITDEQASRASREIFSVSNMMKSDDLGFSIIVALCSFDGETLSYKEHGDKISLNQGRGVYEPSITYFQGEYFLTMRSDKSAYVARSKDGLHYSPIKEWSFDDGSILGSYNTQQLWVNHSEALFLVYTRRGADNDAVFRHRAPLFMAQVNVEKLQVTRSTERVLVPNRGVDLGNFGVTDVNENETWITVAEYMRGEENVEADNSVFVSRIKWNIPNNYQGK